MGDDEGTHRRGNGHHRTVDRIAAILEVVARSDGGCTLSELAGSLDAALSSTQGLVNGLVATGYLNRRDRRYVLGGATYLLNRIAGRPPLSSVTHDDLVALHRATGLTAVLSVVVGGDVFYLDHASDDPRFAYLAENHLRRPPIRNSGGWVLLAAMDKRDLWGHLRELGPDDQPWVEAFLAALPEIRDTGICASPSASPDGDGVSAAIVEDGVVAGAVGLIGDRETISGRRDELVTHLREFVGSR
ncbi:helix-turn-helix domain-containing protein [Pseudonocardia nematodicida]|uniref:Helix-turn-helix domain-containing protein n=1 Tax=Pseudonocardia nematodicida TaxID=1206997 RepID=A0ABV1K514_9PSEU